MEFPSLDRFTIHSVDTWYCPTFCGGVCWGWIKDFPRWSFPFFGLSIMVNLFMMNTSIPGFIFGRDLIGWRAWIPLALAAIVALITTKFANPLDALISGISKDMTVLSFGMFGFIPLLVDVLFDEMDRLYSLCFMLVLTLLILGTVVFYMRSSNQKERYTRISLGIVMITAITAEGPSIYWYDRMSSNPMPTIIMGLIVSIVMISPVLIGIFRKAYPT